MIDKLEFFLALAREQHFGRAAEACGVTQPTLSAGIRALEDALGVLLVHRGSRYHGLTAEGERVLVWARRIVGDTRAMREDVRTVRHGLTGHLRLAVIPTALAIVPDLTTPYRARHPGVRITILSRPSSGLFEMLENLEIDAGITYLDHEPLGRVRSVPLYRERYCLVTRRDGPLGDRAKIGWAELAGIPLCLLTPDMQNRRIIDQMLREAGVVPAPMLESDSMIVLVTHVRAGHGAGIMPERLATTLGLGEPLRVIPVIDPEARHTVGLVVPAREPLTPQTAALVAEARRVNQNA